MSRSSRRVVITGMGCVSPLGLSAPETWKNALAGKSGVARITSFDPQDCSVSIAAEVKGFEVAHAKDARRVGRFVHFTLAAGLEAYKNSGLSESRKDFSPERIGVNIGVGMGGLGEIEAVHNDFLAKGYRRITPFFIPQAITNMASGQLSILLHCQGPNLCNVTACTSSAHSIGESCRIIQRGDADVMIAGGAEAVVSPLGIGGFAAMKALSTRNESPEKASRPFDVDRDGFVMGEGAAVFVLEEFEFARRRGAEILGEVVGYGLSGDAYHMTTPSPEGEGGRRAMAMAIQSAGLNTEQIGYVNAHGTSTPAGDVEEARAIARLFNTAGAARPGLEGRASGKRLHVSSTKSMTGHLLGAAGAIEALFCVQAIREGKIPPTLNLDRLDPGCVELGIDFTAHHAAEKSIQYALSNSFGFGGTNASLIFGAT